MAEVNELAMSLNGPGMTFLHRAGLAGLWLTLENIERNPSVREILEKAGGSWSRTPTSVTLHWTAGDDRFLTVLLKESFKLDDDGIIWFRGIGHPSENPPSAVGLHQAVLGTFLQHVKSRRAEKTKGTTLSIDIDGTPFVYPYLRLKGYKHQEIALPIDGRSVPLVGWMYPGGVVRHSGHGEESTALEEPLERLLPLLFAPVGAIYFIVRRKGLGIHPQFAIAIPELQDLEQYAEARRLFHTSSGILNLYVAGTEEAAYRVLVTLKASRLLTSLRFHTCRVVSFGTVPWSKQQKTRVEVFTVNVDDRGQLRPYSVCRMQRDLLPHLVHPEGKNPFIDVPQIPGLIATNITKGDSWWKGFSAYVADQERREHIFKYERSGVQHMVEDTITMPEGAERVFVRACHEAWRRRLGALGEDARNRHVPFERLLEKEVERTRISFSHCKDLSTFRETMTNFWARSGSLNPLKDHWGEILPFLGPRWQEGRDLALLALASYKKPDDVIAGLEGEGEKEEA